MRSFRQISTANHSRFQVHFNQTFRQQCDCHSRNSPRKLRRGYTTISWLLEISLIGLVIGGVAALVPLLVQSSSPSCATAQVRKLDPIFRMSSTANGKQLWVQRGISEIIALDLATREMQSVYRSHGSPITRFCVSEDATTYMLSLSDHEVVIVRNQELFISNQSGATSGLMLALSKNGNVALRVADATHVRCWDLSNDSAEWTDFEFPDPVSCIALNPDGSKLVVSTETGHLDVYDPKSGTRMETLETIGPLTRDPQISDDGRWLLLFRDESLALCDLDSGQITWHIHSTIPEELLQAVISPDGQVIATVGYAAIIQIFDRSNGNLIRKLHPGDIVNRIVFSPSSDVLYLGGNLGPIRAMSISDGRELQPIGLN